MNVYDINPFIRFAEHINYFSEGKWVIVQDCRILYILSGKATLTLPDSRYTLTPGSLFYCHTGACYNLVSEGLELICLNFDLTQENNNNTAIYPRIPVTDPTQTDSQPGTKDSIVTTDDFLKKHLFLSNAAEYQNDLNLILTEFTTRKIYYREVAGGILKTLLTNLYRHNLQNTDHLADTVSQVINYIHCNYNKPITNQLLSELTSYHENHLNRLFLNHTGTTIHKYILSIRINEAKKLLLNTNFSLLAIAEKTGFNSNTYFSHYFKQIVGMSPVEFRKAFQNQI